MRLRRCAVLMIEPRERLLFDLVLVADGGSGLRSVIEWVARAPHLRGEEMLSAQEVALLGAVSPTLWVPLDDITAGHDAQVIEKLVEKNLLLVESTDHADDDQRLRDLHWRPASAVMHFASRWSGVDTRDPANAFAENTESDVLDRLGPAPPVVHERSGAEQRISLHPVEPTPLDALLDQRVTCRNFDRAKALTPMQFSSVLYRAFGARTVNDYAPGLQVLKKGVPSAGGLHPTEAYVLVQHVDGVAPGLYHYHPIDHALEPIKPLSADGVGALITRFVASQLYFVDAHVLVIPTSRFRRQSWKYRNHAKAYRALILDIGHLSQTLYLAATELGLGAFITAAINEIDIEEAFGMDPLEEGPLAVCGFGVRSDECNENEFDPLHAVWPAA